MTPNLAVDKEDDPVRIIAEGDTTVDHVTVNTSVVLEEDSNVGTESGAGFGDITLTDDLPAGSDVTLNGSFVELDVLSKDIHIDIPSGSVGTITAEQDATGVTLDLSESVEIATLVINAAIVVTGEGTIETAIISEEAEAETMFETAPGATATPAPS